MRVPLSLLFLLIISTAYCASSVVLIGGNVYYLNVSASGQTQKWLGLNITYTSTGINNIYSNQSGVFNVTFLKSDVTVILPIQTNFDYKKLQSVNSSDLLINGIFNSTYFPVFYPNYYSSDGPNATFCCNLVPINVGGTTINAFEINVGGSKEYLAKYDGLPAFITFSGRYMILPVNTTSYVYSIVYPRSAPPTSPSPSPLPSQVSPVVPSQKQLNLKTEYVGGYYYFYVYSNGEPVPNALVSIYLNGTKIADLFTDSMGRAKIKLDEDGYYKIIATKVGYAPKSISFVQVSNYTLVLNKTLYRYGEEMCFSILKDNKPTEDNITIVYPNGTQSTIEVNKSYCFNLTQVGIYELRFHGIEKKLFVYFIPSNYNLPTVKKKPVWWFWIVIGLSFVGFIFLILIPLIRYYLRERRFKRLFKELLTRK